MARGMMFTVEMGKATETLRDREFVKTLLSQYKLSRYYFSIDEFLFKMRRGRTARHAIPHDAV